MTKKRKKRRSLTLNKYHISLTLIIIWILFFFLYLKAHDSLIFNWIDFLISMLFGQTWTIIFFAWLIVIWILILQREDLIYRWLFKKYFILMILLWAILNFPILNDWSDPQSYWGRFWYLILKVLSIWLDKNIEAIKTIVICIFLLSFALIYHSLWFRLSLWTIGLSFNFKKSESEPQIKWTKDTKKTTKSIKDNQVEIDEPEKQTWMIKSLFFWSSEQNEDKTMKTILKDKVKEKIIEKEQKLIKFKFPKDKPTFDINLLDKESINDGYTIDENYLIKKSETLRLKLEEFWIPVTIEWFNIWPTVIQIMIKPMAWIKISKIENLKKDIALALSTKSLRILAPIPGTDVVWIELQNPKPAIVRLWDILWSREFTSEMWSQLTNLTLWKWIDGKKIIKPLEKMPHMLVAWATWSGKSVWVNDFILSLMYQNTPSELKFIMVDPKQVELGIYEWLPYLLSPIITESDKAVKVLKWVTEHMNQRYGKLKEYKVRNIDEYNNKVKEDEKMYRIIVIIDELADLMMSGKKKETETAIARIAQMARAVWIHLIVATQRPSVNVITWLIKANIPTRVAFWVVSLVDSRTIIDYKWAEDLVWRWDMLYIDANTKHPIRIQAPFVSTAETEEVVTALRNKYMKWIDESQIYHPEIINILNAKAEIWNWGWDIGDDEDLVQQATDIIIQTRKASATLLQRKLWIWFARAARVMDILEERWVVWPQDWAKPREILI